MLPFTLSVMSEKPFLWTIPAICCDLWENICHWEQYTQRKDLHIVYSPYPQTATSQNMFQGTLQIRILFVID